jgi:signal transduction histidine kinase
VPRQTVAYLLRPRRWREHAAELVAGVLLELAVVWSSLHSFTVTRGAVGVLAITLPMLYAVTSTPANGVLVALAGAAGFTVVGSPGLEPYNYALVVAVWTGSVFVVAAVDGRLYRRRAALLERILTVVGVERRRLAVDLHDDTIQEITAALLMLERVDVDAKRHPHYQRAESLLRDAVDRLRTLAFQLRPPTLAREGLRGAVPDLCVEMRKRFAEQDCELVCLVLGGDYRYAPATEELAHRVILEALQNAYRHAGARKVTVHVRLELDRVQVTVADNGRGFTPAALDRSHEQRRHLGLAAKRERVEWAGGRLSVVSAPGRGTTIRVELPAARL